MPQKDCRYPSIKECYDILSECKTPKNIIAHCEKVAAVAEKIAKPLMQCGKDINLPLLFAAALLHDVKRVEENHGQKGGELLKEKGYPRVGTMIANHMAIQDEFLNCICEESILYFADKCVISEQEIKVEERLDGLKGEKEKYGVERLEKAMTIKKNIENIVKKSIYVYFL